MEFKPFYIKCEGVTKKQQQEVFDKAIQCGAEEWEAVGSYPETITFYYFGVGDNGNTFYEDACSNFGNNAVEITLEQVNEHLGLITIEEGTEMFCGVEYRKGFMEALSELSKEWKV